VAPENLGFAGGNNLGVRHSTGNLIVLLNNDTVVSEGWLRGLLDAVAAPEVAVASSLVKTVGIPERYYERNGSLNLLGHNIMRVFERPEEILYAGGPSLIYKKDLLGLPFDGHYFAYSEDVYLSLRARFKGYKVVQTIRSIVEHAGGGTTKKQSGYRLQTLQERNRLMNILLFFSWGTILKAMPFFAANVFVKLFAGAFTRRYSFRAMVRAYWELVRGLRQILQKRKTLRQEFRADEREVIALLSGRLTQGESLLQRMADTMSLAYCRLVGIRTYEILRGGKK
jgi:GT2 family glycosyltransferase